MNNKQNDPRILCAECSSDKKNTNTDYLLEIKNLSKTFPGVKALDAVHLNVRKGTVHALMGENGAGKSTLMKCLFGIYTKDEGEIIFDGKNVCFNSPREALDNGISMVHQELNQVLNRNVMENIWLGRFPKKGLLVDEKRMFEKTSAILKELSIDIDPSTKMCDLSVSERQIIEIVKAVSYNARIIVLDEPTSSLTEKEVNHLFSILNNLCCKECSIIYISHKMEEILKISDEITIMRDGKWICTDKTANITMNKIISLMVGRDLTQRFPEKVTSPSNNVLLSVKNLTGTYKPSVMDASFDLYEGEILGVAGLMGSRRTELLETIYGIRKKESGEISVNGNAIHNDNSVEAIKNGFALVTEERRRTGIFGKLSIRFNSIIANLPGYCNKLGFTNDKKMITDTDQIIQNLNVKTPNQQTQIESLSGGNQQKIIIGRWLLTNPRILLLDEPTRGIDVGAKYEIYKLMIEMVKNGKSIIFVSSELPELLGITNRILVMSNGKVAGIVDTDKTNQEELLTLSARYL